MKHSVICIAVLVIASAFVLSAVAGASLAKPTEDGMKVRHTPVQEREMDEKANATMLAGGGGWHTVNVSGTIYKDTFGVCVNGNSSSWNHSSLVFQARDQGATLHSLNFTSIVFDNTTTVNMTYVRASGWAIFNKSQGFWFKLVLLDNGTRSKDMLDLALYKDSNKNWIMDEDTPLLHWVFEGLDGGNIWVGA